MLSLHKNDPVSYFSIALFIFVSKVAKGNIETSSNLVYARFKNIILHIDSGEQLRTSSWRMALVGTTTRLECAIGETNSEFTLTWISSSHSFLSHATNEGPLKTDGKFKSNIKDNKSLASLDISDIIFEDAGKYDCSVTFHTAGKSQKCSWILIVQGRPCINIPPLLLENENSTFQCCVELAFAISISSIEIVWRMGGKILQSETFPGQNGTTSVTKETLCSNTTSSLTRMYHGSMLQCFVRNELHSSGRVTLNVTYLTNVDVIVGSLHSPSDIIKVRNNESMNITCVYGGNPTPNISLQKQNMESMWVKTSLKTYPTKQNLTVTSRTFLYISSEENSGRFRCTATNGVASTTESKEVEIKVYDDDIGPNTTHAVIVVCVSLGVVGALILTNSQKGYMSPCVSRLSSPSDCDESRNTHVSQEVQDLFYNSPGAKETDHCVFYNVLESEEYEKVDHEKDRRQSCEYAAVDAVDTGVHYATVDIIKSDKRSDTANRSEGVVSTNVEESFPHYSQVLKSKQRNDC